MEQAAEAEMVGFFYLTMDQMLDSYRKGDLTSHYFLFFFFLPANLIDHIVFGSPLALGNPPTMTLS
jgi:hypothetical protein